MQPLLSSGLHVENYHFENDEDIHTDSENKCRNNNGQLDPLVITTSNLSREHSKSHNLDT